MTAVRRPVTSALGALVLLVVLATAAQAGWLVTGTGAGTAAAADLPAPAAASATVSGSSVTVSWSAVTTTGGAPASGYVVTRAVEGGSPVAAGGTCAGTVAATSCTDTGLASGTYTFTVVAAAGANWRSPGRTTGAVTVAPAAPPTFLVELVVAGSKVAGTAFDVRITARTAAGATDTNVTGAVPLTFSGPGASPSGAAPTYPASVTFTNGVGTATVTLRNAQTATLTVTGATPSRSGSTSVTVTPGTAVLHLVTSAGAAIGCPRVGPDLVAFVRRADAFGNPPAALPALSVTWTWTGDSQGTRSLPPTSFASGASTTTGSITWNVPSNKSATLRVQASGYADLTCVVSN